MTKLIIYFLIGILMATILLKLVYDFGEEYKFKDYPVGNVIAALVIIAAFWPVFIIYAMIKKEK